MGAVAESPEPRGSDVLFTRVRVSHKQPSDNKICPQRALLHLYNDKDETVILVDEETAF